MPQFKGSEGTVKFIRSINCIFDFLNVRNPWGKGYKSPIRQQNEHIWRPRIEQELKYLAGLKTTENVPIGKSSRNAGFIGLSTAVVAVFSIFQRYVKSDSSTLQYLLTYKLSQYHLELFFQQSELGADGAPILLLLNSSQLLEDY